MEAKADETFGATLEGTLSAARRRLDSYPGSKGVVRAEQLARAILGVTADQLDSVGTVRYQLLTVTAAALAEAERRAAERAVVVVHEFVTDRTADDRHRANAEDFNRFVRLLSGEAVTTDTRTGLTGPYIVSGDPLIESPPRLYVGKVSRNLRS